MSSRWFCIYRSTVRLLKCSFFYHRQKIPPRGVEPLSGKSEVLVDKELTKNTNPVFATSLANLVQIYPDLVELVKVWPELPGHIKAAIKALVETHTKGD